MRGLHLHLAVTGLLLLLGGGAFAQEGAPAATSRQDAADAGTPAATHEEAEPAEAAPPSPQAGPAPKPAEPLTPATAAAQARDQAQRDGEKIDAHGYKNVVSLNTLVLGRGQLAVEYERAVFSRLSLFISPQPVVLFTGTDVEWGFLGEVGARVFLFGEAPAGLFVAPELLLAYSRQAASGVVTAELRPGVGAMLGLTLVLFDRLVLSGGLGIRYLELENAGGRPLKALPRGAIGFAF